MPFENLINLEVFSLEWMHVHTCAQFTHYQLPSTGRLYVPGILLTLLHEFTDLISHGNAGFRYCYHFPATDRETEMQNGQVTCPKSHTRSWCSHTGMCCRACAFHIDPMEPIRSWVTLTPWWKYGHPNGQIKVTPDCRELSEGGRACQMSGESTYTAFWHVVWIMHDVSG